MFTPPLSRPVQFNRIRRWLLISSALFMLAIPFFFDGQTTVLHAAACDPSGTPGTDDITGTIFRDDNMNGSWDTGEVYEMGAVTVTAYWDGGNCDVQSSSDGSYLLTVPAATAVRLEFTALPSYLKPSIAGTDTDTTVTFVSSPASNVDLGVANPAAYCQANPSLSTSCFVFGDQLTGPNNGGDVLVMFRNDWGTVSTSDIWVDWQVPASPIHGALANEIGSVWGLAWQNDTNTLYTSAFLKQFSGFGPGGPGAIYAIPVDPATGQITGAPTEFVDVGDYPSVTMCSDPHGVDLTSATNDDTIFDLVGKCSLGDLEISEDNSTLYSVNLTSREVLAIATSDGSLTNQWAIPTSGLPNTSGTCASDDVRPFALAYRDNTLYVGAVCSAQSTNTPGNTLGDPNDLHAYVFTLDETSGTFSLIFDYNIRSDRGNWETWKATWAEVRNNEPPPAVFINHAEPILADIEFYGHDLSLGFRDRLGDQWGSDIFDPIFSVPDITVTGHGDLVCASWDGTQYVLESSSTCGTRTASGSGFGEGPEFYWGDGGNPTNPPPPGEPNPGHSEGTMGGLVQFGVEPLVSTQVNPSASYGIRQTHVGGINWLNNENGSPVRAYNLYQGQRDVGLAGKANGLGDLEALCTPPPLEIGNYVWVDTDGDGVQDPTEPPISGVMVELWADTTGDGSVDTMVGTAVTDSTGNYYFGGATNLNMLVDPTPMTSTGWEKQRLDTSSDDAEEASGGSVNITSSDLELVVDAASNQTVGMRFNNLDIPVGATITQAHIQFQADETSTGGASLTIQGEAIGNAPTFVEVDNDISNRTTTSAFVNWTPASWSVLGQRSPIQRTPNLANIVQEIIGGGGWSANNSMAFIVTGTGTRTAESLDGFDEGAPELIIEYTVPMTKNYRIQPATAYEVRIPLNDTQLGGRTPTVQNYASDAGTTDLHDSDGDNGGLNSGYSTAQLTTGMAGDNQHEVDFGFSAPVDRGDLPDSFDTTNAENGPSHGVAAGLHMGDCVDSDNDGQPDALAGVSGAPTVGDDGNVGATTVGSCSTAGDDEDGVTLVTPLIPGSTACVQVATTVASGTAVLNGWVDTNGDGDFDGDADDAITFTSVDGTPVSTTDAPVPNGTNSLDYCFTVPSGATFDGGETHLRWRLSSGGSLSWNGAASDGEVEDYYQPLACIGNLVWDDTNGDGQQDAGEPGLNGVDVTLIWGGPDGNVATMGDNVTYTTSTATINSVDGKYQFCGLLPNDGTGIGTYQVALNSPPSPYVTTADNTGNDVDDSDGSQPGGPGTAVVSPPFTLSTPDYSGGDILSEPTGENSTGDTPGQLNNYPDSSDNLTFDFGFAEFDWGDLPDGYNTTAGNNGALHTIFGPQLGDCVDAETSGTPSVTAVGDDGSGSLVTTGSCATANDDEDGVTQLDDWNDGDGNLQVNVANGPACLNVWLDYGANGTPSQTGNGAFDLPTEHVLANVLVATGVSNHSFSLPINAADDATWYMRVRLTPPDADGQCGGAEAYPGGTASPVGLAQGGEVEDYFLVLPSATAVTLSQSHTTPAATSTWPITVATLLGLMTLLMLVRHRRQNG